MARRKRKIAESGYTLLAVELTGFDARVKASLSYDIRDARHYKDDAKIYEFASSLEIEGVSTYPDERVGDTYRFAIHGSEASPGEHGLTLGDCHARDENGSAFLVLLWHSQPLGIIIFWSSVAAFVMRGSGARIRLPAS